jgi:hypothetical protein
MQDHICRIDENLLHRTAGPYIGSMAGHDLEHQHVCFPPEQRTSFGYQLL